MAFHLQKRLSAATCDRCLEFAGAYLLFKHLLRTFSPKFSHNTATFLPPPQFNSVNLLSHTKVISSTLYFSDPVTGGYQSQYTSMSPFRTLTLTAMAADQSKAVSTETVAVLCAAIMANGGTIGGKQYEMMSACDGKRTASSFEHEFRAILKRAREIKDTMDPTDIQPVTPKPKRSRNTTKTPTSSIKKRGMLSRCSSVSISVLTCHRLRHQEDGGWRQGCLGRR